jgi:beta-glucosidase
MGQEFAGKGIDVQLGPVVGPIGRFPAGGRNWEGFSPDPYLSGQLVAETVQGIQSAGVIACTKHYIANEQEHFRQVGESTGRGYNITETLSSNIDDKTMHELYLWPFADAVRAGTGSIMCSYQQINNSYGCANSYTLNHLLKNELGFQGFVVADWGAQHSGVSTAAAGLDMTMPGDTSFNSGLTYWGTNMTIAILNGTLPEYRLDDMAVRIMAAYYYVGRDEAYVPTNIYSWSYQTFDHIHAADPNSPIELVNEHVNVQDDHAANVRQVGAESVVLLKNEGALPLTGSERTLGLIGEDACSNPWGPNGCPDRNCDNGTLAMGWGSGTANFPYLITPQAAIEAYVRTQGQNVETICDNYAESQIQRLATIADKSLVFINADSGEGFIDVDGNVGDRKNLSAWHDADRLIENVTTYSNNTIIIIHSVGTVNISAWYDNENVTAILWAGLPGQETGNSLVDVLYGAVNPGGKLPFTIAANRADYGADVIYEPNNGQFDAPQDDFGTTGVYIDYRHFDQYGIEPIYEFGFGLSYTTFEYSNLVITSGNPGPYVPGGGLVQTGPAPTYGSISTNVDEVLFPNDTIPERTYLYIYPYLNSTDLEASSGDPYYGEAAEDWLPTGYNDASPQPVLPAGGAPGGNPGLWETVATVTATITNTGSVDGDEVAQLYVGLGDGEPPKVLRGFDRITIPAGGSATFTAELTRRDVSTWDVVSQNWVQAENPTIYVGSSSRNTPLQGTLSGGSSGGETPPPSQGNDTVPYPPTWPGSQTDGWSATTVVTQISDGQIQAPTQTVSQISDGQVQAPTHT